VNFLLIVGGLVVVAASLFALAVAVALLSQRVIPSHVPNWQAEVFPMCARLQQDYQDRVAKYADFEAWASRTHVSVAFHMGGRVGQTEGSGVQYAKRRGLFGPIEQVRDFETVEQELREQVETWLRSREATSMGS
jgi:hypothetical protein